MKKLIIILILFFNISPDISKSQISIDVGCKVYAQYECPNEGGGTNPGWWEQFTTWLVEAYNTVVGFIGELFNSNGVPVDPNIFDGSAAIWWNGGYYENYEYDPVSGYYYVDTTTATVPPSNPTWWPASINEIFLFSEDTSLGLPSYDPFYSFQFPFPDCQGVTFGSAFYDRCGRCVRGTTSLVPCNEIISTSKDTLKATKVNCDSIDINRNIRAVKSTQILDFISNSADSAIIKDARNKSSVRKFEVGFTIRQLQPTPGNIIYKPANYDTSGSAKTVSITNTSGSIANLHVHPAKDSAGVSNIQSNSPFDFYAFLEEWADPIFANKYQREYVISGDSAHNEYAIVISDSAAAKQFMLNHPKSIVVNYTPGSPTLANWLGTTALKSSYYNDFNEALKKFAKEGYPSSLLNTYANVYMLQTHNIGIRLQQKVNGQFKELNFVEQTDAAGKKHFKITICQ